MTSTGTSRWRRRTRSRSNSTLKLWIPRRRLPPRSRPPERLPPPRSRRSTQARARLAQAQAQLQYAETRPQQISVQRSRARAAEAETQRATAVFEQAQLNLQYTTIVAPVSGVVGQRSVQPGQNVLPGQQLMTIVPLDSQNIWVTANFKETQLKYMRPGQPVRDFRGHLWPHLRRARSEHRRRQRSALQPAAARECHGKLRQGRPANSRQDSVRKGAGPRAPAQAGDVRRSQMSKCDEFPAENLPARGRRKTASAPASDRWQNGLQHAVGPIHCRSFGPQYNKKLIGTSLTFRSHCAVPVTGEAKRPPGIASRAPTWNQPARILDPDFRSISQDSSHDSWEAVS